MEPRASYPVQQNNETLKSVFTGILGLCVILILPTQMKMYFK